MGREFTKVEALRAVVGSYETRNDDPDFGVTMHNGHAVTHVIVKDFEDFDDNGKVVRRKKRIRSFRLYPETRRIPGDAEIARAKRDLLIATSTGNRAKLRFDPTVPNPVEVRPGTPAIDLPADYLKENPHLLEGKFDHDGNQIAEPCLKVVGEGAKPKAKSGRSLRQSEAA